MRPVPTLPEPVPYAATAVRPVFADLPAPVRDAVSRGLGGPVVHVASAGAGFTGGFAAVVTAADGARAFVKAASATGSPAVAEAYRTEARINAALPARVPAPRVRWTDEAAGWTVVGFDAVDGHIPAWPWRPEELRAVLAALAAAADALATVPAGLDLRPVAAELAEDFGVWRRVAGGTERLDGLDPLAVARVDDLAALESGWAEGAAGTALVHGDLRPDNTVVATDGRAWICDWNWPTAGAGWFDLVCLLPTVHASGLDASAALADSDVGRDVPAEAVDGVLAALAGFFAWAGRREPFPGASPWITRHRLWYGAATLSWLAERRGWRS